MRLTRNLLSGVASSVCTTVIGLVVVPLYLKILGIEAYGLVGFFMTAQALLQVLDLGLTPTMNREVARRAATHDVSHAASLLHTLSAVYWGLAAVIAAAGVVAAPAIAGHWLQSSSLSRETVTTSVVLIAVIVAVRWPVGLYVGALMGAERQTVTNGLALAMSVLANLGAVAGLAFVSPTPHAFFVWQGIVGVVYAAVARWAAWRTIGRPKGTKFDLEELRRVWRFSAGMGGIAMVGLVISQLDKVFLSRLLPLADFGRYVVATTVASGMYVLVTPVFNALYPRLTALVAEGRSDAVASLYRNGTRFIGVGLFPIATILVFSGEAVVRVWTGDATLATSVAPVLALLVIGTALHGVMYVPYALQLAHGATRIPLFVNSVMLIVFAPLLVFLARKYGMLGGGIAWLLLHLVNVALATWITHRHLLGGMARVWVLEDVGVPLGISAVVGWVGHEMVRRTTSVAWVEVLAAAMLALVASALSFAASPRLRAVVWDGLGWRRGAPAG